MKKKKVLLKEGLIKEILGEAELLAGRCHSCGRVYFPTRTFCQECHSDELAPIVLSVTGDLYTYTVVNMPSAHYSPPYIIGWVEYPEGVRVFGQIEANQDNQFHIGMKMKAVIRPLWEEDDREIISYKFIPQEGQGSSSDKERR